MINTSFFDTFSNISVKWALTFKIKNDWFIIYIYIYIIKLEIKN